VYRVITYPTYPEATEQRSQLAKGTNRALGQPVRPGPWGIVTVFREALRLPMLERVAEVLHVSVEDLADTAEVRQAGHCLDVFEVSAIRSAVQSY
jgi:hypothetical protein